MQFCFSYKCIVSYFRNVFTEKRTNRFIYVHIPRIKPPEHKYEELCL